MPTSFPKRNLRRSLLLEFSIHAVRIPFGGYMPGGAMDPTIASDPVAPLPIRLLSMMLPKCSRWHRYTRFVFGFTSSSYVRGAADDAALKYRLEARIRGIPVVIPCAAAAIALAAISAKRIALVSPPWFSAEMDQQGVRYFQEEGFEIVSSGPASYSARPALPLGPYSRARKCRRRLRRRQRLSRHWSD